MHDKCDFWEISYIFGRLEIPLDLKVKLNFRRTGMCVEFVENFIPKMVAI